MNKATRHPKCENDPTNCRIRCIGATGTLMSFVPVFDGNGNQVENDPNTMTISYACNTCSRRWVRVMRAGHTEVRDA